MIRTFCPACRRPTSQQPAQCGHPGDRHGGGLLEGEVRRFARQLVLARGGELGERALADTEHLVTGLEARDLTADRNHHTRHVEAGNRVLGRAQADHQACGIGHTGHQMPGAPVEAGGADLHQHLVGSDHRPLDLGHSATRRPCRTPSGRSPASADRPATPSPSVARSLLSLALPSRVLSVEPPWRAIPPSPSSSSYH